uniref:non-specific serine/threonine protein kinase n=1 Tax=Solanum lycopersicum TaxID=4081 RepID=A0A3Q7EHZ1_SOLLC
MATEFRLPEEIVQVLPSDPFEQLDLARKITSIALSTRISALESEADALRRHLSERDDIINDLNSQLDSLDSSLADAADRLSRAEQEKESLVKENSMLSNTVRKLNRDVAKLEAFRKTLMRSLNEEEDSSAGAPGFAKNGQNQSDQDSSSPASIPPQRTQSTEVGYSHSEDAESETSRPRISPGLLLASQTSTPRLTPPGSPPSLSASVSPSRSPRPLSPRRHSISFSTVRGMYDDRSSAFSTSYNQHGSMSSLEAGSQTAPDGLCFIRSRLSYEQFGGFLANVKELNSHKQTKEINGNYPRTFGFSMMLNCSFRNDIEESDLNETGQRNGGKSLFLACKIENTCNNVDEEESDEELFKVGPKLLLCASSISLTAEEFRSLSMGEDHDMDEDSTREVIKEDKVCEESIREASENQTDQSETTTSKPSTSDSDDNLIGEGGYSEVYKGLLKDGQPVAVKRLTRGSQEEMTSDYLSELGILVHVKHANVANVIGYGVEGGMHLVLPLSPHGSLANMLSDDRGKLTWQVRYNIAVGTAAGLAYLHEGCQRRIIHRDIKAANVLLTEDFEAQITDFGLAKWLPDKWTHLNVSQVEGTFGYLPPEFFMHGIVDEKTDVYAFGVLLLEIVSGRPALDEARNSVVMWVEQMLVAVDGILQSKKKFQRWPPLKRRCAVELDALLESP